jgi:hypothetical protein
MTNVNDFYSDQESRFAHAFCDHSALCSVECACERVHYVTAAGHGDYDEGQLEKLVELTKQHPGCYIAHATFSSIDVIECGGKPLVMQCPCERTKLLADFLDGHIDKVLDYVASVHDARRQQLEQSLSAVRELVAKATQLRTDAATDTCTPPPFHSVIVRGRVEYPVSEVVIPATGDHPDLLGYMVGVDDGKSPLARTPEEAVDAFLRRRLNKTD